jgi:hypothetical protein
MGAIAYQPVAFRAPGNAVNRSEGTAHQTFLKASMPTQNGALQRELATTRPAHPVKKISTKPRPRRQSPLLLLRSSQTRVDKRDTEGWVVLTSWHEPMRPRVVFTVDEDREFFRSYAAVPTAGGWLVIQL